MRSPRLPGISSDFFDLSRRLESPDGAFNGVIAVAVRPSYFEDFYALIGQTPSSFYALVRADGAYLARFPILGDRARRLSPTSMLRTAIGQGLDYGLFTVDSEIDGVSRRVGFRKLPGFPVYALAGVSSAAIRAEWLATMGVHLIFGLPATLLILTLLWIALRRTQRLYQEADRREAAEGALRQAQRLEAIGQLTGGVAHDFNNLLMIVSGSAHRLRRDVSDEKQLQLLDAITNATQRGESLTRQLLAFSRRQMLQPTVIDLAERLPELKDMLSRSLRGDIEIRVQVSKRPCRVKVDASELELALLNLAFNARDAMPSGGTLTIAAKPIVLRGKAGEEGLSGEFVAIRVADTGRASRPTCCRGCSNRSSPPKTSARAPGSGSPRSTASPGNRAVPPSSPARCGAGPRSRCSCRGASKPRPRSAGRLPPPARRCPPARCCWSRTMRKCRRSPAPISPTSATASPWPRARNRASSSSRATAMSISSSPTY
jgi:two-component system NtrC family sensor kinase